MKRLIILTFVFHLGIRNSNAQSHFYFDKWKAKGDIVTEKVVFFMDSTSSEEGAEFNEKFGKLLSEKLQNIGIQSISTFQNDTTYSSFLIIKFDMMKPAYVKLNTFGTEIPLCNRFEITQINKLPDKKNREIRTILAISVDNEEKGLTQASIALVNLIFESIEKN